MVQFITRTLDRNMLLYCNLKASYFYLIVYSRLMRRLALRSRINFETLFATSCDIFTRLALGNRKTSGLVEFRGNNNVWERDETMGLFVNSLQHDVTSLLLIKRRVDKYHVTIFKRTRCGQVKQQDGGMKRWIRLVSSSHRQVSCTYSRSNLPNTSLMSSISGFSRTLEMYINRIWQYCIRGIPDARTFPHWFRPSVALTLVYNKNQTVLVSRQTIWSSWQLWAGIR